MNVEVNFLAVLLAAVSSMIVGSIWYARGVFGRTWSTLAQVDMSKSPKAGEMVYLMGSVFLASLVTAYVLAHVSYLANQAYGNSFLENSLASGFWLWLGFTAARIYTHDAFEGRPTKLTLLTFGNEFVTIMVMALIIGIMGA